MKRLGVLIHGPEVIDEGEAEVAIERLKEAGFVVEAALAGISGKTAVIDAGTQQIIDISKDRRPSETIVDFLKREIDFIVLLNHAKREDSGIALGQGILRNFMLKRGLPLPPKETLPISFLQLEYSSRIIIKWFVKHGDDRIYCKIVGIFNQFIEKEPDREKLEFESICRKEGDLVYREIKSVEPGEKIVLDGVIVGTVSDEPKNNSVTLVAKEGKLMRIDGGRVIKDNLEKLPLLDLERVMIKTADVIRRTEPIRQVERVAMKMSETMEKKKIASLFYTVETLFPTIMRRDRTDTDTDTDTDTATAVVVAVTIGDDTTAIAGDILKRLGIRMIGITDGDADGLITGIETGSLDEYEKFLPYDSVIIRLTPGKDNIIGEMVKTVIFNGRNEIELSGDLAREFADLKRRILELAKDDILDVLES